MIRIMLIGLALLALAGAAEAGTLTDICGATVTVSADGSYSVSRSDGFAATVKPLVPGDDAGALNTINAMRSASCPQQSVSANSIIDRAAFWNRFTDLEKAAIVTAAQTSASIGVWLQTAQAADTIGLTDVLTKQGLDVLVAAGLLTAAREAVILTP